MRRFAAARCIMREPAALRMCCRRCARWRRSLAAGSRRMPGGTVSNNIISDSIDGASDMPDTQAVPSPPNTEAEPCGDLSIRTLAMPADTNANGDIFGGWVLSQMDIGGGIFASKMAKSRTGTVAIDAMNFRKPVFVGDVVSVHANLVRLGKTSVTVHLEAWVLRRKEMHSILVTDGNFTYVSIDERGGRKVSIREDPPISA